MQQGNSGVDQRQPLPRAEIEAQLQLILASGQFNKSERMCRFLSFVVEHSLDCGSESLKEYTIGVEVFDKEPSFDPRTDTNVRTEARRLRAKLIEYYDTTGQSDGVRIKLPKGGYTAIFEPAKPLDPAPVTGTTTASAEPPRASATSSSIRPRTLAIGGCVLALVALAAGLFLRRNYRVPPRKPRSVAVLPFLTLGPGDDYFSDGLTEEILNHLAKVPGLKVVARTSSFQFKGKNEDVRTIGARLNVDAVLEGSVRRAGSRLRITPQLIATADGYHIWSETFERDADDVFGLQDEISRLVVKAVGGGVVASAPPQPRKPEAYHLFLRARHHFNKWAPADFRTSIGLYEQAISLDSRYAAAYAGLAEAHGVLAAWENSPEDSRKARAAARKAIEVDSNLAEGYFVLANIEASSDYDWEGAGRNFERALALNPGSAQIHDGYAVHFLAPQLRLREAIAECRKALDLDPLSLRVGSDLGALLYFNREYDAAVAQLRQVLDIEPRFGVASMFLFKCYLMKKMFAEARQIVIPPEKSPYPEEFALHMGRIRALSGNQGEARHLLGQVREECSRRCGVSSLQIAWLEINIGDRDGAFKSLEKAREERNSGLLMLQVDPVFDPLRSDPRYHALLARLHLAQ